MLGVAVGDALGLPYEKVSRRRAPRLLGKPDRFRFFFRRGMVSDDTEHTCLLAQSLIATKFDINAFPRDFARRLRCWFAALPAGIGRASVRSCLKLWCGVSPERSGVFSAGNGPAMRAAIFGCVFDDVQVMVEFVRAQSQISHSDPKAEFGAIAIALATLIGRTQDEANDPIDGEAFVDQLEEIIGSAGKELIELLRKAVASVNVGESTADFATSIGCERGVSGYTYHTVPVAIHVWLTHHDDYEKAITTMIECGGDADTTAAIVGGIIGARLGKQGIPAKWLAGVRDWPMSIDWISRLAKQLSDAKLSEDVQPLRLNFFTVFARNMFFLSVVLFHGFRRLAPPY